MTEEELVTDEGLMVYIVTGPEKQPMGRVNPGITAETLEQTPVMEVLRMTTLEIARVCEEYAAQLRKAAEKML